MERNNELVSEVSRTVGEFWEAERRCANAITALVDGTQWTVDDGSGEDDTYGVAPDDMAEAGETPWGSAVERNARGWEVHHHIKGFVWDGVIIDGIGGTLEAAGTLVGLRGMEEFKQGWAGVAQLAVGVGVAPVSGHIHELPESAAKDTLVESLDTADQAAKGFVAWDTWEDEPARAAGATTFNVVTTVVTGGAGASVTATGAAARAAATTARVSNALDPATHLVNAARAVADLPRVGPAVSALGLGRTEAPTAGTVPLPATQLTDGTHQLPDGTALPEHGSLAHPDSDHPVRGPDDTVHTGHDTVLDTGTGQLTTPDGTVLNITAGTVHTTDGTPLPARTDIVDTTRTNTAASPTYRPDSVPVGAGISTPGTGSTPAAPAGGTRSPADVSPAAHDANSPRHLSGPAASWEGAGRPRSPTQHPAPATGTPSHLDQAPSRPPGGGGIPGALVPGQSSGGGMPGNWETGHGTVPGGEAGPPTGVRGPYEHLPWHERPAPTTDAEAASYFTDRANRDPSWFADHYRSNGYRKDQHHVEYGYHLPTLVQYPPGSGHWVPKTTLPPPIQEKYLNHLSTSGDRSMVPREKLQQLDESAHRRQEAINADRPAHSALDDARMTYRETPTEENRLAYEAASRHHRPLHADMTKNSEDFGETVAEHHAIPEHYPTATRVDNGLSGNDRFDQIYRDANGRYIVVEAKGSATAGLGNRIGHSGRRVNQGTREYFETIIEKMDRRGRTGSSPTDAKLAAELQEALDLGKVDYALIKAESTDGNYSGYSMSYFDISENGERIGY